MAETNIPLRVIVQPKAFHRERYSCEIDRSRNRSQRFIRAESNPHHLDYPTIEIPNHWNSQTLYIRVTLVTVRSEQVPVTCIHPYSIDASELNVIKDLERNTLYFPISEQELHSGHEKDIIRVDDLHDARKIIEAYQLGKSQLLFSLAELFDNDPLPVIYDVTSVYSCIMTATAAMPINNEELNVRCSPKKGCWEGGDDILMFVPKIDKRKVCQVHFENLSSNIKIPIPFKFVDMKTIAFKTPPCPVQATGNERIEIPLVVSQSGEEIARINFLYQSCDTCSNCDVNSMFDSSDSLNADEQTSPLDMCLDNNDTSIFILDCNKISAEDVDFDEKKWETLINSDEVFTQQFSKSINTTDPSNLNINKKDIVKLSVNSLKITTFINSNKFIHTGRSMTIFIPPCSNQRVRYENECEKILRYLSVPNKRTMTIEIPDLRDIFAISDTIWIRITRTTIDHRNDHLIFYHPYPTWIKDRNARIHNGSIFLQITDRDMKNGFIEIDTLALIRLKQDDLAKINTLGIYSRTQLNFLVFHHTYDDDEFNRLPTGISLYSISQVPNNEHHNDVDSNLLEPLNELSPTSSTDEFIKKILDSDAPSPFTFLYDLDESLFPGYEFDENQIEDTFEGLPNEATTTTATINAENNNGNFVNGTSSESISNEHENLKPDDNKSVLKQSSDDISLQMIDNSIEQRTMIFESQPPASIRYRYGSDGKRQIDKSRTKPSIVKLPPGLKDIKLNSNQSFGLRLGLITYSENLLDEINFHVNKLEYHSNDVHKFNDNTVGILLTPRNIEEERIVLSRQSIVKTTLNNYKPKLIPLCLTGIPNDPNENMNEKISVREAKEMYKKFNLKASRIICQLVIKQNDLWHFTNIKCETQVIQDKDQKSKTQKRSAKTTESDEDELLDECPSASKPKSKPKSKSTKRKKRSA
ncbi:unnamed protein product [Rotaria sp. Silwood1]|nr:unnamed protein product [Rotaria sp. Silwood1]